MKYWNIRFKSRDGNTYLIQIGGNTGSTDVELQGADEPFSTEEKDTDDMFVPVLTESGYISIYDNGYDQAGNAFDWHDLIPQNAKARPVTVDKVLPNPRAEVWRGYLQPQTFQGEYLEEGQKRKFPVVNSLAALESEDVEPEKYSGAVNFARLIYYLTRGFIVEYQFQGEDALDWLQLNVNWSIFADVEDDDQTAYGVIYKAKYNKLQALEEVCRFFGWTCRQKDRTLYFASPDDPDVGRTWISMDDAEFDDLGSGIVPQPGYHSWNTLTLSGSNKFASTDNNEIIVPGIRKATITADAGDKPEFPSLNDEVFKRYLEKYVQYPNRSDYSKLYYFYIDAYGDFPTADTIFNFQRMIDPLDNTKYIGSYFEQFEYFTGNYDALQHKHNYSWSTRLLVQYNTLSGSSYPLFTMKSRYPVSLKANDILAISAKTYHNVIYTHDGQSENKEYRAAGTLYCKLRVGDYYYDGYNWRKFTPGTGVWPTFQIAVGSEDNNYEQAGKIIPNRLLDSPYEPYDGLGIYMTSSIDIGGIIEFQICGYDCSETYNPSVPFPTPSMLGIAHTIWIENLKIEKVGLRASYQPRDTQKENVYTAEFPNTPYRDEREESTTFASFNNNIDGTNVIMDDNLGYVSEIGYTASDGGYSDHPEQHLADRMANFHRRPRTMLELELDTADIGDVAPDYKVQDYLDRTYYPLVIGRDWREGVTKLKLIEL